MSPSPENIRLYQFLSGAVMMGYWVASIFFFKFWRKTGDSLFKIFAFAFLMMGVERLALGFQSSPNEAGIAIYLIRWCAYVLILTGIIAKNRPASKR